MRCVNFSPDVTVGLLFFLHFLLATWSETLPCNGSANFDLVYDDTVVKHVVIGGAAQVSSFDIGVPITTLPLITGKEYYAGENGVADYYGETLLFPAGRSGMNSLFIFDFHTGQWSSADVHCRPVGAAFGYDGEIVGFCEVASPTPCVPYYKLQWIRGQWADLSRQGLCSYPLTSTNLSNPFILSYEDQYGYSVKLYFAEQDTGVLHEIDLIEQHAGRYNIPSVGDHGLKVGRILPAVAEESFTGVRIELIAKGSPNTVFHVLYSSTAQRFSQTNIQTETTAFDSKNLNYFVSFTANLRTMIVSFRDGTTRQYPLGATLDDPIQCENMAGADSHYLICLTGNNLNPIMIDVADGTSQTIPIGESPIAKLGTLDKNMFWLLNSDHELSFYMITNSSALHIGMYTVRSESNFRLIGFASNISCTINVTITHEGNHTDLIDETDGPDNQTTNHTGDDTRLQGDVPSPANETNPTTAISHPHDTGDKEDPVVKQNKATSNKAADLSTGEWVAICLIGVVIVVLLIIIFLIVIGWLFYYSPKRQLKKLTLLHSVYTEDDNSLHQNDGKDKLNPGPIADKLQSSPESTITSAKKSLSFTGETSYDSKSEQFSTYVDMDRVSTISAQPCSDENSSIPATPELRFSPDGTDLNT